MGLLDCVASPEGKYEFEENDRPIPRPKELSRSDHDISRRRGRPLFASQTSLKNVRDIDFWRQKVLAFLFSGEGREDIGNLRVPLKILGYPNVTDFIAAIPPELFEEYENQVPDESIFKDDKIFWVRDGIAEPGIFKWQGVIEDVNIIGLQLDRKKAVPFGVHDGKGMFYCKPGHRALVPAEEVIPYKKFLRRYLGLPPRKDSLRESVRLSAKAIAARNSKPGDRVYLPKERKWATVIWIGKIDGETVVDLVYEQPKPEAGKQVSPDEPCISRSLSLRDFIGELESEPNSPNTPISPPPTGQTVTATVENHVQQSSAPSSPVKKTQTPPTTPTKKSQTPPTTPIKKSQTPPTTPIKKTQTPPISPVKKTETPVVTPVKEREPPPVSPVRRTVSPVMIETPLVAIMKQNETPPVSPQTIPDSEDESDNSDEDHSSDEETESEDDTGSESDRSISDESVDGRIHTEEPLSPAPVTPVMKSYQAMENISTEVLTTTGDNFKRLPSPKRKGFFGFSPKPSKISKPKSPVLGLKKVEPAKDLSMIESEQELIISPQPPPRKSRSTSNLFSGWKFGLPTKVTKSKGQKRTGPYEPEEATYSAKAKFQKKKSKSDWGGIFKSRSKGSLQKLSMDDNLSRSQPECQTPIDDMMPPDKIPTPPPEKFNERQIDRPNFLNLPVPPPPTNDPNYDRSSAQSPVSMSVPSPPPSSTSEEHLDKQKEHADVHVRSSKEEKNNQHQTDTDESDGSESGDEESTTQKVDAEKDTHAPPPLPKTPIPDSESVDEEPLPVPVKLCSKPFQPPQPTNDNEELNTAENEDALSAVRVQSPTYLEKYGKEAKVRNRPSSFGSFLARIKNQKGKPDGSLQSPRSSPFSPTLPDEEKEKSEEQNDDVTRSLSPVEVAARDIKFLGTMVDPTEVRPPSPNPSTSSVELTEDLPPVEGSMQISRTLVKPPKPRKTESEGNQEGIILDMLEVQEPPPSVISPPPAETPKTPKRKGSKGRTFSFTFSRKRKPSNSGGTDKELQSSNKDSNEAINNRENVEPEPETRREQVIEEIEKVEKEQKPSKTNSFRDSFKRTFSLTRKKRSSMESQEENTTSSPPPSNKINKPRPVTMYIDNNEAVAVRNSFRTKRPASVHVDIKPWDTRHGREGVDIYDSSSPDEPPGSPGRSPNPALTPKQPVPEIPKHRIFTTPAFFQRKGKKTETEPLISTSSKALYKKQSSSEDEGQLQSPTDSVKGIKTPPPLPAAPPPSKAARRQPSFAIADRPTAPEVVESSSPATKLKSALKQRKEIGIITGLLVFKDCIPNGLKIGDRVLWYSAKGPVPGTVQKLFKDGTDKYTAMVQFDREVSDEPLRLIREGDAYMITVEELITPDMFGSGPTSPTTPSTPNVITVTPATPETPLSPSVRFDEADTDEDEEHDLPPPFQEEEVSMACGFRRGIQCQDKSCCLETILFSLFYTTNAFDISMLYANTRDEDSVTRNTRRILRREMVDPLRREGFCKWETVKRLRDAVKPLSDEWQTMSTDAEVMMFILFDRALKLGKFISYSNNMSDYLHQLVVDPKDLSKSTTVQHLFESSLQLMDKIKLKTVPTPALILEMPRSNDKLMQYKAIIPNLALHVSHIMENGPRLCICGAVAKYECMLCAKNVGKMSIVYCDNCRGTADVIHFQLPHEAQLASINQPVILLDLVAIICVKGGHYSSFVKCGNNNISPWVYFDGAEIENPKVCIEQNLGMWLDRLEKYPGRYQDALQYPLLTQILQDSHICIYQPREKSSSV